MLEQKDFVPVNARVPYDAEIEQTSLVLPYDQAAELVDEPADEGAKPAVPARRAVRAGLEGRSVLSGERRLPSGTGGGSLCACAEPPGAL